MQAAARSIAPFSPALSSYGPRIRPRAQSIHSLVAAHRFSPLRVAKEEAGTLSELNGLWRWCHQNGVPSVGEQSCKLSLFVSSTGERGFYAVSDIEKGEVLLSIPLKLALADHRDDPESNQLIYEGAPWSVRLACRLLRERALGIDSVWFPYIQSLPVEIPCALCCFSYEDIKYLEYDDIRDELDEYIWLISDAWQRLSSQAHANSSRDDFDWAMSVVHSRTFAAAGKGGPTDVHMLVPLADMFNHGGDRCKGLLKEASVKLDSVEWIMVPPEKSNLNQWEMQFVASSDVAANEQVYMSYGERNNDDFLLYYGYIPPLNPKDDYVLFSSLEEALEWYCQIYLGNESAASLCGLKEAAVKAGEQEEGLQKQEGPDADMYSRERSQKAKIRIMSGGFVDGRALAAFESLGAATDVPVRSVIAERSWELLSQKSSLLDDLQLLAEQQSETEHDFPFLHRFYSAAIEKYEEAGGKLPAPRLPTPDHECLSFSQILLSTYLTYKKMILWDVLLGLYRETV